ncbi:Hsp20/alpha crystallin family protein [Candidatus Micrarchaeota archaeon]|nr:Hsp20/alpha crystallin family protein [Candidatus Micrarchaeota archaeon]
MAKRGRLPSFFDDDFDPFADLDQFHALFEDMLRQSMGEAQSPSSKNPKTGMQRQPGQPLVYGFSMRVGPDGKPHVEQFGNVRQGKVTPEREPLVDVVDLKNEVRVLAEIPGVDKSAFKIHVRGDRLHLDVKDQGRPFSKVVQLPAEVDDQSAKASYKNGILEVLLKKKPESDKGAVAVR